jgi:hypothetical protein
LEILLDFFLCKVIGDDQISDDGSSGTHNNWGRQTDSDAFLEEVIRICFPIVEGA